MTATRAPRARPLAWPARAAGAVRPRPIRLRDREFWGTQALIAGAAALVYGFDGLISDDMIAGGLHDIPIMFFVVPVLYAALAYGLEGAILTTFWAALIVTPHTWFVSHERYEWLGDMGTMFTVLVAGTFLAIRTEAEREARRKAEEVSERLRLLNDLAAVFDRPLASSALLQELADRLGTSLSLDSIWVQQPGDAHSEAVFVTDRESGGAPVDPTRADALAREAAGRVHRSTAPWLAEDGTVVVPLCADGQFMGAVGASRASPPLDEDGRNMLAAAAAQASVTLANAALQRARDETLTSYARQVTNAQEEERRRVARELHDGPTQVLSGLCRGLDILRAQYRGTDAAAATAEELRAVAEDAVADLRRMTRDLRPTILDDLGLVSAIEWLASDAAERTDLAIEVQVTGGGWGLANEQELGIFRIVQETLSNVEKHAHASHVRITIEGNREQLHITVRDDGQGFEAPADINALASDGRYGLLGMQERARLCAGALTLRTAPGEGTTVAVQVRPTAS